MSKLLLVLAALFTLVASPAAAQTAAAPASAAAAPDAAVVAKDPGVRGGTVGAGDPLPGLTDLQQYLFSVGQAAFNDTEGVADGLGPRFNMDSCLGCHAQPASGGTSPALNPQVDVANKNGAQNYVPLFVTKNGPVREARFIKNADGSPDGGVHALFVISGRVDGTDSTENASGCYIKQEDFQTQAQNGNLIFRIPTPVFGAGLIEAISDSAIKANLQTSAAAKAALGIAGRANHQPVSGELNSNGNDGTISRFGWKAQNKSLLLFSGEAYNVEMGISNELFQTEREENAACQFKTVPNDATGIDPKTGAVALSDIENFAFFMRFLAPPVPSTDTPGGADSIARGLTLFGQVGCALCHTPSM